MLHPFSSRCLGELGTVIIRQYETLSSFIQLYFLSVVLSSKPEEASCDLRRVPVTNADLEFCKVLYVTSILCRN